MLTTPSRDFQLFVFIIWNFSHLSIVLYNLFHRLSRAFRAGNGKTPLRHGVSRATSPQGEAWGRRAFLFYMIHINCTHFFAIKRWMIWNKADRLILMVFLFSTTKPMEMREGRMSIKFEIKKTRGKEERGYRTLHMKRSLLEQIEAIAAAHNTSFNNVVISMIEACLCDEQK